MKVSKKNNNSYFLFLPEIVDKIISFLNFESEKKIVTDKNIITINNFLLCSKKYFFLYYHDLSHISDNSFLFKILNNIFDSSEIKNIHLKHMKILAPMMVKFFSFNITQIGFFERHFIMDRNKNKIFEIVLASQEWNSKIYLLNILFEKASSCGNIEIIKLLLKDNRIDPGYYSNIALINASCCAYVDIVKLLLQNDKVDPNARNNYSLKHAIFRTSYIEKRNDFVEIANLLLNDKRMKIDTEDLNILKSILNNFSEPDYNKLEKILIRDFGSQIHYIEPSKFFIFNNQKKIIIKI